MYLYLPVSACICIRLYLPVVCICSIQHNECILVRSGLLCLCKKKKFRHRLILNLGCPRCFRRLEVAKNEGNEFWVTTVSGGRDGERKRNNKNLNSKERKKPQTPKNKLCYPRTKKETTERKKTPPPPKKNCVTTAEEETSTERKKTQLQRQAIRLEKRKKNVRHKAPERRRKIRTKESRRRHEKTKKKKRKKNKVHCSMYKFYVFLCRF